jgi:hypothetical protein
MAVGDDGIQLNLPAAAAATDEVVAAGAQWDALFASVPGFIDEVLSSRDWGTDAGGQDFGRKVASVLPDFAKSGAAIGPAFHKVGTDGRAALTEKLPDVDQQGRQQLDQL